MNSLVPAPQKILDLGIVNPFTQLLVQNGYSVDNTNFNQDLDQDYHQVQNEEYDIVTAFEIFEHMLAPYNVLKAIKANKLVVSVPLSLWFAKAYWNENDEWDRHYHEFEPRQLDMLLEKTGWKIVTSKKWAAKGPIRGIRSIFRLFTPRYYMVYCERY